jgi:hypothetical protein
VDRQDELLARILYAAVRIKKREDQLRRIKRNHLTRFANYTLIGGGISKIDFQFNKFVISL